jgi:hypothetical protein
MFIGGFGVFEGFLSSMMAPQLIFSTVSGLNLPSAQKQIGAAMPNLPGFQSRGGWVWKPGAVLGLRS